MDFNSISHCFCYTKPEGWSDLVIYYVTFFYFFIPWRASYIFIGLCLVGGNVKITFVNIIIYWIFWAVLWRFALIFKVERPIAGCLSCSNEISREVVNMYGFPDPYFVTTLMFSISFIVIQYQVPRRKIPFIHYIIVLAITISYAAIEVVLNRMYVWQMLANILLSISLEIVLVYLLKLAVEDLTDFVNSSWIGKLFYREE